jgi:DNA-binding Lrp family transcriptional regulator
MADPKSRELAIYVQSKKVITSFYRPPTSQASGPAGVGLGTDFRASTTTGDDRVGAGQEEFFLSDDQARALALAEEVATQRGYTLKVTDVGRAGLVERLVTEHLRNVQKFPVLVGWGGIRLEGPAMFTTDQLAEVMPTEMHRLRAFTYLKVRGGDLDQIRESLLRFPEVRELHLLAGDWDVFVVLEFDPNSKKRQILDFVTDRIRGIPDVIDTSTLVPEYSVTKLPFAVLPASPS